MTAPGWGGLCISMGIAFLIIIQMADIGGKALLEPEDHQPTGADRQSPVPEPVTRKPFVSAALPFRKTSGSIQQARQP